MFGKRTEPRGRGGGGVGFHSKILLKEKMYCLLFLLLNKASTP